MKKKITTKSIAVLIIISLILTSFTGCSSNNNVGKDTNTGNTSKAKDTLFVATAYDAKSLDPSATNDVASANIMKQIYETLVQVNDKNELEPMLAESFKQVDDVTYEFKLRKGVKFHNGEELKAKDVKFSFEKAISGGPLAYIFGDIDASSFNIPDDYTISFKLKRRNTAFLASLAFISTGIVNEKAVKEAGDKYAMQPVGTGPFKFVSWRKGDTIELEKFDNYYGEKPKFNKMVIRVIPEPTNRVIELESGGVDIAFEVSPNDIKRVEENPKLQILRTVDNSTTYMGFQTEKKPYNDVKVRQAISYAIDVSTIIDSVWKGVGKVAVGPMSPIQKYFNSSLTVREYNIDKAKELLKEAGYPNGFKAKLWTNEKKERVDIATIIQSQLKEVGIEVEIQVIEWGAYLSGLYNGEQEMFIIGYNAQVFDPDNSLYQVFHSSMKGPNGNMAYFGNDKVDELLDKGRVLGDSEERKNIYYEVQEIIKEQTPWVFLYNGEQVVGTTKNVKGFTPSKTGHNILYNVSFE